MEKNCEVSRAPAAARSRSLDRLFRAGLICLGTAALELIEGLATGSYVFTFPASAAFLMVGVVLLVVADHSKGDE